MADAIELFSAPRRVHGGRGSRASTTAAAERALFVDLATELDVPIASVSDATLDRIGAVLDPGLEAANPLDAWGRGSTPTGSSGSRSWPSTIDDEVAAMALRRRPDAPGRAVRRGYLQVARDVWAATTKPFCVLSNLSAAVAADERGCSATTRIPVLEGTPSGLSALKHLLDDADVAAATEPRPRPAAVPEQRSLIVAIAPRHGEPAR